MNWGKALAFVSMGLSVGASCGYGAAGDWRRCLYWAFGAAITATVTL